MPRVDEILTKYGEMIENVLSGQGKVGAILRRGAIYDSLNAGRPSTVAAQPQYSPGLPDMSGAPQNANESLSDLMTFVGSLGSGAVGDPNEGVNWAGIDAQRANKAVDVQELMDQRATQQAGMINQSNINQDQISSELGRAGANARIGADQVELGGAELRQREQSAVDDLLAQLAGQQEKRSMFDERLASDQQIAEMQFGNRPEPLTFEQRLQIAGRGGERESKLLSPEELEQQLMLKAAGRAPAGRSGGGGRAASPETFGAPFEAIDPETGKPAYFRPGNRGSMKELDVMPLPDDESPSVARTAPEKSPGSKSGGKEDAVIKRQLRKEKEDIQKNVEEAMPVLNELESLVKSGELETGPLAGRLTTISKKGQRFQQLTAKLQAQQTQQLKGSTSDRDFARAIAGTVGELYDDDVNLLEIERMKREVKSKAERYGVDVTENTSNAGITKSGIKFKILE